MDIYEFIGFSLRKAILFILPLLLTLFPNYGPFISIDQQFHNSVTVVAPIIAQAFVDRDVEALEEYMCLNIKENVDDLPGEIQKMYDLIDGEITEFSVELHHGSWSSERKEGTISQSTTFIYLTTPEEEFRLLIVYEVINTISPREARIRQINIYSATKDNTLPLAIIKATEGINCWHG